MIRITSPLILGAFIGCGDSGRPNTPVAESKPDGKSIGAIVNKSDPPKSKDQSTGAANQGPSPIQFEEVAEKIGVSFTHVSGYCEERHFPSANSSGVSMFDFDGDGDQDLYFLTCRKLPFEETAPKGPVNKLFQNRHGRFVDVGAKAGLDLSLFSHGVCQADVNQDGFKDLILSGYSSTRIMINNGDGTFSRSSSFRDDRWGSSIAALDVENDGRIDFYVTHYGKWSIATNEKCSAGKGIRTFCSPKRITFGEHALFRNLGDGKFVDITQSAKVHRVDGRGQGIIATDIDIDGRVDLVVANDLSPNFVFRNLGGGKFEDISSLSGVSANRDGNTMAGMGIDSADVNGDSAPELTITNFFKEYTSYYKNLGKGVFVDESLRSGMRFESSKSVNWGTRFVDFDNDALLDVFTTAGHVDPNVKEYDPSASYRVPPLLWRNVNGVLTFQQNPGPFFKTAQVGRGAAFGDLDDDGRTDIAINHIDTPAAVLRNVSPNPFKSPKPWIRVQLIGTLSNRDAIGARVEIEAKDLPFKKIVRQLNSGASYLSSHDQRIQFGLKDTAEVDSLKVFWPSGKTSSLIKLAAGSDLKLVEPLD
jgi:hypothetical protein